MIKHNKAWIIDPVDFSHWALTQNAGALVEKPNQRKLSQNFLFISTYKNRKVNNFEKFQSY